MAFWRRMAREKDGVLLLCALFCFIVNGLCCELQNPRTITQDSEIEIIEVTIYFTGADPACDECATSTDESSSSFTYSSSSACGNANNTWSLGDWEGGLGSFQDPTPAGSSVVGASMEIWGYWNYQLETEGTAALDGISLGFWRSPLREAPCRNCMSSIQVPLCSSDADWPGYDHGELNSIKIIPQRHQRICLSHVILSLQVLTSPPAISQLVPPLGPFDARTAVAVDSENSLKDATNLRCRFGTNLVPAVLLTPFQAVCGTPKINNSEYTPVSVTEDGKYFSKSVLFFYYEEPELVSISPSTGSPLGGTLVTIRGSPFINASEFICASDCLQCQWAPPNSTGNISSSALTPATYVNSTTITCISPPFSAFNGSQHSPSTFIMSVSVTQNGQIFTQTTLEFTFSQSPYLSWRTVIILVGSVVLFIAFVSVFVFFALGRWENPNDVSREMKPVNEGSLLLSASPEVNSEVDMISPSDLENMTYYSRGSFAEIYRAQWCGVVVAVKRLPFAQGIDAEKLKDLKKEAELMRQLRHPNVVLHLGTCFPQPCDDIWLVMEFLSCGSLFSIIHSNIELRPERIKTFCEDTAKGMLYLHTREPSILHRDLKSHNLLLDDTWRVKVADFGLSCTLRSSDQTSCGTPAWSAPEVLRGSACTKKSDVYSFAIVVWELLARSIPYEGKTGMEIVVGVSTKGMRPPFQLTMPPKWRQFIMESWDEDPAARPSFEMILNWLRED